MSFSYHIVIPARFDSQRLPGKPLLDIAGKPLIQRVYECAQQSDADSITVATDNQEIFDRVEAFRGVVYMTRKDHLSGTDRVAEATQLLGLAEDALVLNLQGDEPLIDPKVIDGLVDTFQDSKVHMSTVVSRKLTVSDLLNPNIVKAILDNQSNAIEFKRNIFDLEIGGVYRHIGIYGFRRRALYQFTMLKPSWREKERRLEQMRALDNGLPIHALILNCHHWAVDTKEDLEKVAEIMSNINEPIEQDA